MNASDIFLPGMATMGFIFAGVFFIRFWRRTNDRLFLAFGIAFWLLALNRGVLALSGIPREELSPVYLLRIMAFGLIISAIIAKNVEVDRSGSK